MAVSESFIAGLPKVELHVHHVGSVPLRAVAELAARHPGTVPSDPDELARYFIFDDNLLTSSPSIPVGRRLAAAVAHLSSVVRRMPFPPYRRLQRLQCHFCLIAHFQQTIAQH